MGVLIPLQQGEEELGKFHFLYNKGMADQITILLALETLGGPRHIVLDRGTDPPHGEGRGIRCGLHQITLPIVVLWQLGQLFGFDIHKTSTRLR